MSREIEDYLLTTFDFVEVARLVTFNGQLFVFVKRSAACNQLVEVPDKFGIKSVFYVEQFPITVSGEFLCCFVL